MPVFKYEDLVIQAGPAPGLDARVPVNAKQGSESLIMGEITIPPHSEVPSHIHNNTEEAVIILEGTLDVLLGSERESLGPGNGLLAPAGSVHGFVNRHDEPAKILYIFPTHHVDKEEV